MELDTNLRKLDPNDPVKYDFALFGLGIFENWGGNDCDKRNLHVLRMVLISLRTPDRLELENHELNDVL